MSGPLDLDAIEAAARAATPGPWEHQPAFFDNAVTQNRCLYGASVKGPFYIGSYEDRGFSDEDAAYIAALSPDVALALVARVRELEAALRQIAHEVAENGHCGEAGVGCPDCDALAAARAALGEGGV